MGCMATPLGTWTYGNCLVNSKESYLLAGRYHLYNDIDDKG